MIYVSYYFNTFFIQFLYLVHYTFSRILSVYYKIEINYDIRDANLIA